MKLSCCSLSVNTFLNVSIALLFLYITLSLLNMVFPITGTPRVRLIDNVKWVETHINNMDIKDPDTVSEYVMASHPYYGLASLHLPQIKGDEDITTLTKYADAVVVACYVEIGNRERSEPIEKPTTTTFGNIAFVSLHHPDPEVRKKLRVMLKTMLEDAKKQIP